MQIDLEPSVHAVMIDDDLVFLDVDMDAYFCLPLPPGLVTLQARRLVVREATLADELIGAGLAQVRGQAETSRPATDLPAAPSRTARRLIETAQGLAPRMRPMHWRALGAALRAGWIHRTETFGGLLEAHRKAPPPSGVDLADLLTDLAIWRRLVPWLPMDGVCLFRSSVLAAFLCALGHRPTWVFGVRTWPFQPHCWLQIDDIALDDEHERLCAFTPILGV